MNETPNETKISREKFEEIFKLLPYPVYIWKKVENDFILIDYNAAAKDITDGKIQQYLEIKASELHKDEPEILDDLKRCFNEKRKISREMNYIFKTTGIDKIFDIKYQFISPDLVMVLNEDITEKKRAGQELKESEEQFRIMAENADIAFGLLDLEGKILMVNDYGLKMTGYTREEMLQLNVTDIALESIPLKHKTKYWEKLSVGEHVKVIGMHKRKDGSLFPVETTLIKIKLKDRPVIAAFIRDITKLKEILQESTISEELSRLISKNANDLISIFNHEGMYLYCNEAYERILGYRPEELIGTYAIKLMHPENVNKLVQDFEKANQGEFVKNQLRVRCKDGSYKWIEYIGRGLYDEQNNLIKTMGIGRDITMYKEAEQKLKESEKRLKKAQKIAKIGDWEWDLINNIITWSDELYQIFGLEKATHSPSIEGFTELLHPDDVWVVSKEEFERSVSAKNYELEYRIIDQSTKEVKYVHVWQENIFDLDDKPIKAVGTLQDITDRQKAEEELKKSERKYREAYNRAEFYKDLFAHDMNNILQVILSSNHMASTYLNDAEKRKNIEEMLRMIDKQVQRGANLISNVRRLSQLEEAKIYTQPTEVFAILNKVRDHIIEIFHYKEVSIKIGSSNGNIIVLANELLKDVFENILNNAIHHNINPNVEILIKISREQKKGINYCKLEFMDNGRGIANEMKGKIFKRDYREEQKGKGMGLGLSLVKKIIESYNGEIWVEDRVQGDYSKGSNFILLIPEGE